MKTSKNKTWRTPKLEVYGSVQKLTQTTYKYIGGVDGVVLMQADGTVIGTAGS